MKILHISASYKPAYIYGGPVMSVAKLCEELSEKHQIKVYTTLANGKQELNYPANETRVVDGIPVTYFKRITKDHSHLSPALYAHLWKTVKNFDLVHVHAWWNLVSVISCSIALLRGVKVLLTPRGTLSNYSFNNRTSLPKQIFHQLIGKPLLKRCHLHVTSQKEKTDLLNLVKRPKGIHTIPNFVKLSATQQSPIQCAPLQNHNTTDHLRLIFLSRIEEKKGLDILLNALVNVTVPYYLTIAGDGNAGYINQLKGLAASNNIQQHMSWIGFQQENKFDILARHDLLILPSHDENFANVVIESLSVGTAVLISKNVGLADYVADKNLGWTCNNNIAEISNNISQIRTQTEQLKSIRETSPLIIRKDFNDQALIEKYKTMYQNIINH